MNMNQVHFGAVSLDELREAHRLTATEGKRFELRDTETGESITFKTMMTLSHPDKDMVSFTGFGGDYFDSPGLGKFYELKKDPDTGALMETEFKTLELIG